MLSAESVYAFRHALLREAAYQLQLPADRARLHELAFEVIEALSGGRPPEAPPLGTPGHLEDPPLVSDVFAEELAGHARLACHSDQSSPALVRAQRIYLRRAAVFAASRYRQDAASENWQRFAELVAGSERGEALHRAGTASLAGGRSRVAEGLFRRAVEAHREGGNRAAEGRSLGALANVFHLAGRADDAEATYREAMSIHREVGDRRSEGVGMGDLASLLKDRGRIDESRRGQEAALAIHREVGNRRLEGIALSNLANLHGAGDRTAEGEAAYREALAINREVGDRRTEATTLGNLAGFCMRQGRLAEATRLREEALKIARQIGNRRLEGIALGELSDCFSEAGRATEAERGWEAALTILREVGDGTFEGITLGRLGRARFRAGRIQESARLYAECVSLLRLQENRELEGSYQCEFALVLIALRRPVEARDAWSRGACLLQELDPRQLDRKRLDVREACARIGIRPLDEETRQEAADPAIGS
jgi:tetratricopeptide (TPR) repeat protein